MTYIPTHLKRDITIDSIITIHYFEYMKDFVFSGESHDFWELLYVDKGTVKVRSADNYLVLNTGDIIFHQPNEFHAIESIGKNSPNLVAISFYSNSPAMNFFRQKNFTLDHEERRLISLIIHEARETFSTPIHLPSIEQVKLKEDSPFGSQQLILLYLELFLITIIRNYSQSSSKECHPFIRISPERRTSREKCFEQILQYMEFHICDRLTVSDLCSAFSLSRSSLQALFDEKKSCGAINWFHFMKIERAKDIIRDGNMTFTEIAYFLSYSSLPHFSKQFKQVTGMSPLEYSSSVKGISQALLPSDSI